MEMFNSTALSKNTFGSLDDFSEKLSFPQNDGVLEVCFLRALGTAPSLKEQVLNIDRKLDSDSAVGKVFYKRMSSLPAAMSRYESDYYIECYDAYVTTGKRFAPTKLSEYNSSLRKLLGQSFQKLEEYCQNADVGMTESMLKNMIIKHMNWFDSIFRDEKINWEEFLPKKIVLSDVTKKHEYLFAYFLTLLGCDVLLLQTKSDIDTKLKSLGLSQEFSVGDFGNDNIPLYKRQKPADVAPPVQTTVPPVTAEPVAPAAPTVPTAKIAPTGPTVPPVQPVQKPNVPQGNVNVNQPNMSWQNRQTQVPQNNQSWQNPQTQAPQNNQSWQNPKTQAPQNNQSWQNRQTQIPQNNQSWQNRQTQVPQNNQSWQNPQTQVSQNNQSWQNQQTQISQGNVSVNQQNNRSWDSTQPINVPNNQLHGQSWDSTQPTNPQNNNGYQNNQSWQNRQMQIPQGNTNFNQQNQNWQNQNNFAQNPQNQNFNNANATEINFEK